MLLTISSFGQSYSKYYNTELVECYFDKRNNQNIYLYSEPDGNLLDSLINLENDFCWYRLSITESKNGWFKVNSINAMPDCHENQVNKCDSCYTGMWVKGVNLKINIADLNVEPVNGIKFFEQPDLESKVVYHSGNFLVTELIKVKGNWAKVRFIADEKIHLGWLQKADQCSFPWTSCPKTTD